MLNVMIVHALLCNLFLFMHACVVAQSTLCTLSSVLLSLKLLNNPLDLNSVTEHYRINLSMLKSKNHASDLVCKLQLK